MTFKVCVVGAGKVAGEFGSMDSGLSHASVVRQFPNCELWAVVDPDKDAVNRFKARWGVQRGFDSIEAVLEDESIDIFTVSSPTSSHSENFFSIVDSSNNTKGMWMEKPLASTPDASFRMSSAELAFPVVVNYFRRWNPEILQFKTQLAGDIFGTIRHVSVRYTKGLKVNASHYIDLICWLVDEQPKGVVTRKIIDVLGSTEKGVDFCLSFSHFAANFEFIPDLDFVFLELDIFLSSGVIRIYQRGQRIRFEKSVKDPDYKIFKSSQPSWDVETGWRTCFVRSFQCLLSLISENNTSGNFLKEAYLIDQLCEDIIRG